MRRERPLPPKLQTKLASYSAAAAAALAPAVARADIINVPVNEPFTGTVTVTIDGAASFTLAGGWDFTCLDGASCLSFTQLGAAAALGSAGGLVAGHRSSHNYFVASFGGNAGPSQQFGSDALFGIFKSLPSYVNDFGPCLFDCSGALGIEFKEADGIHYGWIAFELGSPPCAFSRETSSCGDPGEVYSYAYSTVPGQAVSPTPEPATLGLLALGSLGLGLWRRRKATTTAE